MRELAIYFTNGHVAYFKKVKNVDVFDDDYLTFEYFGEASQLDRYASFERRNIAGYSLSAVPYKDKS